MGIFAYSPAVWCYIESTTNKKVYDVSGDLVRGQTILRQNAPHQMTITLMNRYRRYDTLFAPNDLFTIYMKRVRRLMIMSGYLDSVPWYSTWERSVQLFGTCTMKRLLHKYWDPGTMASVNLMTHYGSSLSADSGMSQKAQALLTQVGGWPEDTIHIGGVPVSWAQKIEALYSAATPVLFTNVWDNLGGTVSSQGNNSPMVGQANSPQSVPKGLTSAQQSFFGLPNPPKGIKAAADSKDFSIAKPVYSPNGKGYFYCQLNWGYHMTGGKSLTSDIRQWLGDPKGSGPVMVYCPDTGKTCLCQPVGDMPGYHPNDMKLGLSAQALKYLGIHEAQIKQGTVVNIGWCDKSLNQNHYPYGPWPVIESFKNVKGKKVPVYSQASVTKTPATVPGSQGQSPYPMTTEATTQGQQAADFATSMCNKSNYILGTEGQVMQGTPIGMAPTFDCSGLCWWAWTKAGLTWTRMSTEGQWWNNGDSSLGVNPSMQQVPNQQSLIPGDLIYYNNPNDSQGAPNHMGIYIGIEGGQRMTVQAHDEQEGTTKTVLNIPGYPIVGMGRPVHYQGYKGTTSKSIPGSANIGTSSSSPTPSSSGSGSGTDYTLAGSTQGVSTNTSVASYWQWYGQAPNPDSPLFTGIRGLLLDQPLLPFINTVMNASMRSWCSAPNGDFIAWFPDYFGAYNSAATINIADVELMDFSMSWSDENMVTHQYVAASWVASAWGSSPAGEAPSAALVAQTDGVVTLDMGTVSQNILQTVLNLKSGDASGLGNPQAILNRFGARPNFQQIGLVIGNDAMAQFWYALYLFQLNWASMFTASVPTTFMPEAFPGMLIRLEDGFQAYINQVQHTFDFSDGGPGFSTQMAIMAPSDYTGGGLYGLPNGGAKAVV
jgi:cell wall-associated NlpC family hydrolase